MSRKQFSDHNKAVFQRLADRLEEYVQRYRRIAERMGDEDVLSCPFFTSLSDGLDGIRIHVSGAEEVLDKLADRASLQQSLGKVAELPDQYSKRQTHPDASSLAEIDKAISAKGKPKQSKPDSKAKKKAE